MTLRLFSDDGDDPNEAPYDRGLSDAVQYEDIDAVIRVIEDGASPNSVNQLGESLLLVAARNESREVVSCLLSAGASPQVYSSTGASPLWFAAIFGWLDIAQQLTECGADCNEATADHETPLSAALQAGNWALADWLVEMGGVVLDDDAYHAEMGEPYAKPGFDFRDACDENFRKFADFILQETGCQFVEASRYPGVFEYESVGKEYSERIQSAARDASYLFLPDQQERGDVTKLWRLFPTSEKYHVLRLIAPSLANNATGADVQSMIWILVDLDQEFRFRLIGLGPNYLELEFLDELHEAKQVADRLLDLGSDLQDVFGSRSQLVAKLQETKRVTCFWNQDKRAKHE